MSIASRVASALGAARSSLNSDVPLTSTLLLETFGGRKTKSGQRVTVNRALGVTAYYRGLALLSGAVGGLDLLSLKRKDRTPVQQKILEHPTEFHTAYELWELCVMHLLLWGNFYAYKVKDELRNTVKTLVPLDPRRITPAMSYKDTDFLHPIQRLYKVQTPSTTTAQEGQTQPQSQEYALTEDEILHVPGFGYDGIAGVPPLQIFAEAIGVNVASEEYAAKFFGSGGLMSGFLKTDRKLDQPTADALKQRWQAKLAGSDHAHEVAVLDAGATFESLTIPPEQSQYIQAREFGVMEVARMLGVPPHLLMAQGTSSAWGTSIEQGNIGLVMFTIRPLLRRIEARVSDELLPSTQVAEFQSAPLLRGDTRTRFAAYLLARKGQWESVNEIRMAEGLARIDKPEADDPMYVEETARVSVAEQGGNVGKAPPPADGGGKDTTKTPPDQPNTE